ncbi:MAG: hypothetical protein ACPGGL_08235, partial [Phycisphaerales bacterium]
MSPVWPLGASAPHSGSKHQHLTRLFRVKLPKARSPGPLLRSRAHHESQNGSMTPDGPHLPDGCSFAPT